MFEGVKRARDSLTGAANPGYDDGYMDETPEFDEQTAKDFMDDNAPEPDQYSTGPGTPNPPIMYENEGIQYYSTISTDDTEQDMIEKILNAPLSKDNSKRVRTLVKTFSSFEYVLNNYQNLDVIRTRWLMFRSTLNFLRINISAIEDEASDIHYMLKVLETKFYNKMTRSIGGFERIAQESSYLNSTQKQTFQQQREKEPGSFRSSIKR